MTSKHQQLIISGLGGQGVLFITKLLAGAAMAEDLPVFTSETHGMAQRGGNVISYLKIGDFSGPLIRPGRPTASSPSRQRALTITAIFSNPAAWPL
jgi:indolepyruvate ferredoxin oxidoreductase beta subunit